MSERGARLLSLDGGGTRGLSALYTLREIMNSVVPGQGGTMRPCEYFDLIAGTGLNGLCALLFARFCYTVDETVAFFHDLSEKLDDISNFHQKVLNGEVEEDLQEWIECMSEYDDPKEQLEALRQGTVQDCWSAVIEQNVSDGLERYLYMSNGKFDFKAVSGEIECGRSKAFAVSSESQGYGSNGGVSADRQYHVPKLHRTYKCRHGKTTYTLYAIGLGTVASPSIMKPGVIFPDLLATGQHSEHNPVVLIQEECQKIWPGLPVSIVISVGTGSFDLERSYLESVLSDVGHACTKIVKQNQETAKSMEKFVLPFNKELSRVYFRFDNPYPSTFFEFVQRHNILEGVKLWTKAPVTLAQIVRASSILKSSPFPQSPEDMVALASMASLLYSLSVAGYTFESLCVSDVLANYILYESGSDNDGSFRKLCAAAEIESVSSSILGRHNVYAQEAEAPIPPDLRSEAAVLHGFVSFGDQMKGGYRRPGELKTVYDCVAAAYFCLAVLRERYEEQLDQYIFASCYSQLSVLSELPQPSDPSSIERMENLLTLTTVAALCNAAATQLLRGVNSLAYCGPFLRHVHHVLSSMPMRITSPLVLDPIATFLALLMEKKRWSPFRDDAVLVMLKMGNEYDANWSLVNLAMQRLQVERSFEQQPPSSNHVLRVCSTFVETYAARWYSQVLKMIIPSVQNGWSCLIWKSLRTEALDSETRLNYQRADIMVEAEAALRLAAQAGHPFTIKRLVEALGIDACKVLVNRPNPQGLTSLHLASKFRAPKEVFRLLHILSSDVDTKCQAGRTPLSYCFPRQIMLPSLYQSILDLISEFSLPTTIPLDKPNAYGGHGKGKAIDPRTSDFRIISSHLVCRNADISIADLNGMTAVHIAAKESWGDNLDIFFMYNHGGLKDWQKKCLLLADNNNRTVLDYSRSAKVNGGDFGGEEIVVAEMRKRILPIPPATTNPIITKDMWKSMPAERPRLPPSGPATNRIHERSEISASSRTPSPLPPQARSQLGSRGHSPSTRKGPSPLPSRGSTPLPSQDRSPVLPSPRAYQDPSTAPQYPYLPLPTAQVYNDPNFPS